MACRRRGGGIFLLSLGSFVFAMSLCHCTRLTRLKALDETRETSMSTEGQPGKAHQHHGRLLIGQKLQRDAKDGETNSTEGLLDDETEFQADMDWWQAQQDYTRTPKPDTDAIDRLLKMDPRVECTGDSMKLLVQDAASTPASLLFVDRGHLSPLSLSKLPSSCGYTIRSTRRDLILVAPYNGCFVMIEEDSYVLPLHWWGLPVRMSCPLMRHWSTSPPMVTCHAEGMVVKMEWAASASKIKVNLDGNWEPLLKATNRCMFSVVEHPEGVVISIRYAPCLMKKDGLYTLELGADGETKVSCPSLTAEPAKPAQGIFQSETQSGWTYGSTTGHSTSAHPPPKPDPQVPGVPPKLEIASKPSQGPKKMDHPQYPYYPLLPSFLQTHLVSPNSPPAAQPLSPTPFPVTQTGKKPGFAPFPLYPPLHEIPPMQSLGTKFPPGKYEDFLHQSLFNVTGFPQKPVGPPVNQPKGQGQKPVHPFLFYPQHLVSQGPHFHSLQHQKLTKKPGTSLPADPERAQGELYQPFYLFYTQQKPASKPTASQQPQPDGQSHLYQPFYPYLYNQTKPGSKPPTSQQPQPGTPHGQMYQPFYPYYFYNQTTRPGSKPTGIPQPAMPHGHMHHPFNPYYFYNQRKPDVQPFSQHEMFNSHYFYNQTKPVSKPTGASQPSQPEMPHGHMHHLLNPHYFYNQRKPGPKPTGASQPEMPHGHMHHLLNPHYFYSQRKPGPKPTGASQPEMPHGHMHHLLNPHYFYNQRKPGPKPTGASQPEMPHGHMHHLLNPHYFYNQRKPGPKPTGASQPEMPHGHMYHLLNSYYSQRNPGSNAPGVSQPGAPGDQLQQQMCFSQMLAENQLANMPTPAPGSAPGTTQGQLYDQCQLFRMPGAGTSGGVPTESSAAISQLDVKPQQGQMAYPYNQFHFLQQPQFTALPPGTDGQQHVPLANNQKLQDSVIQQMSHVGISSQVSQPSSLVQPFSCPQFCAYGYLNCCPHIAFHQHLHISPPGLDGSDLFYHSLPFLSLASYSDLSSGPDPASTLQKHVEATPYPQAANTFAQALPLSPPAVGEKPPSSNPAALPGGSPSRTANEQVPVPPYFWGDSLYPYWPYVPALDEGKYAAHSDPSQYQISDNKPSQPVVQHEPFNTHFSKQQIGPVLSGSKHGEILPDLSSYLGYYAQHVTEQPNKPAADHLQSLHQKKEHGSLTHDSKRGMDHFFFPHYMPQDAPVPTQNDSDLNYSQDVSSESISKNSSKQEQTQNTRSESRSYVLLQHGPPGRDSNSFRDSTMPLRDLVGNSEPVTLIKYPSSQPQNLEPLQEKDQQLQWLAEGMFAPLPGNVDYMHRLDELPLPLPSTSDDPQVYFPPEESSNAGHLKAEELWKSPRPSGLNQRFPPHVPEKMLQRSSADQRKMV